jgi:hypothetical protein
MRPEPFSRALDPRLHVNATFVFNRLVGGAKVLGAEQAVWFFACRCWTGGSSWGLEEPIIRLAGGFCPCHSCGQWWCGGKIAFLCAVLRGYLDVWNWGRIRTLVGGFWRCQSCGQSRFGARSAVWCCVLRGNLDEWNWGRVCTLVGGLWWCHWRLGYNTLLGAPQSEILRYVLHSDVGCEG